MSDIGEQSAFILSVGRFVCREKVMQAVNTAVNASRIEELIGNTPLIGFERITAHLPQNIEIYAKAEWTNPGGSVKDRPALNIIHEAERAGHLPGKTVLERT